MKKYSRSFKILGGLLSTFFLFVGVVSAGVTVYAEGAYSSTELVVYIYADITAPTPKLCSFGVKLIYPVSDLTVTSAEKNESVWYLGTEPYMDPDTTTTPGEIIFIGGKLDTADPGVIGNRVLLGWVKFNRLESSMPFTGSITMGYGRGPGTGGPDEFNNFVAIDGTVIDGGVLFDHPAYGVPAKIVELGDVNASGFLSSTDVVLLRSMIRNGSDYVVFADMNGSGFLSSIDFSMLRSKLRP